MANKKLEVNVQHIIKDIEAGKFTSFQSILNETGGQHIYEAVNEELRKYLKENNAVMISATQLAHLRETGYKDFESERKALETQLKSATGDLKKQIENKLKDLKKFQYYSERKAPIGDELHKILELTDKGLVDLNDAVKAANQIMQQMQIDPHTNEKLKSLVGKTSTDTMKNFRRAIKNAQDFQKMKISAGMVGGETETARSMAFKKDGKLYVVSGSTDWTKAKEGKIGDYKTTASFSAMHNLIQSVVNATLIRAQEGANLPITSKVAHLPITAGRMKYSNTLPGVYDINVGSYQEGVKLISDLVDVLEGRKSFTDVKIPGSVQGVAEKGSFTYKNEVREAMYYNGKPIGQWVGQTVEEVKSLLDSLQPQQRQQFLGSLFGETDGKPWYNTENAKLLKEAFRSMYQPTQKDFKTYGGMSLSTLSGKFASGEITREALINAIKEGAKTQTDIEELASRLFFGEDKYYSGAFVNAIKDAIPEISNKISDIFDRELDKTTAGYLSGFSEDEKPQPSKHDMYTPDVWELEEKRQQAWIEAGVERRKLGYTDKPLFDDKGIRTLADRMTRLIDFYQRTTSIFNKVAEDINKNLPADTEPYTGEELARTYLARKSPEVYDRYMRSMGLYEGFTKQAQDLPLEEQIQWIRGQLDTFIAEEGNLLNTFDTFTKIADQKSKEVFSGEFARKISYVGKPSGYVAPGTLYGLLMGSTFGVAQEGQMPEFDKQRKRDIYGRTLSAEAIDRLTESQVDNDISKIDFYKQKLSEMTETLGVSSEKVGIFSDYLDKVQKVADQAGIELEQVLEGVDEQGFIKEGSLLDKQLRAINEAPVESLYLPTSGKHGIGGKARESLFGLFDDTGIESLATQYDIYLDEQDAKRKEELKKQNDIRVQKEQEFTKLVDTELENRLKFLYAETAKPEYIKAQEAAERNEDSMGLSPEMFKGISGEGQKGLSIGSTTEKSVEETEKVNKANEQLAETIKEETELKRQSIEQIKTSENIQDVRKRGKIDNDYDKWIVDRVVKNELGEVTDTIYKKARKSSGSRGPSGISQVVEKVIPAVANINNNIDEINKKIPSSFKDIDWESFQRMYDKTGVSFEKSTVTNDQEGKTGEKKKIESEFQKEYNSLVSEEFKLKKEIVSLDKERWKSTKLEGKQSYDYAVKNIDAEKQWRDDELKRIQKRKAELKDLGVVENKAVTAANQEKMTAYLTRIGVEADGKMTLTPEEQADYWSQYERALDKQARAEEEIFGLRNKAATTYGTEKALLNQIANEKERGLTTDKENVAMLETIVGNLDPIRLKNIKEEVALNQQLYKLQALKQTRGATSIWNVMENDIRRAIMRIADFGIAAKILNKIPQDIQKVIQYTKELDSAMTNIRIVGGYNEEQAKRLMRSYSDLGNQLSTTTTEIAQGMNDWLRQGYEAEEQLEALVTASTKLSKLGMISASEATTALTSALKAFNLAAEDAIKVVDKLTKVDQLAAVSAGGISTALQKSATSAKLAGMSMDELIGSVSVIGEVTQQSMDTVGNAMKSILARYGNVKAGVFTQMGLNDDGETSENINDIEKVLSKLGIKVRSSAKEMRSITDVLDDVNSKWSTFDTVTKNAIATAFGGTRMRENFLVLMENWDRVRELTEESANAAGTADEKYSAYTDSIEAGLKRVQNAWENMSQKFESSWLIKSGIGFMEQFVSHLDTITRLLTIFAATKFSDKIFTFGANTVKGIPGIFKKLTGLGPSSAGSVTYDEKGGMIVTPQETQRDFLIRKGTQSIVDTLNKNGANTNTTLNRIQAIIQTMSLGAKAQYDPNTGKIISGLSVDNKDVRYVGSDASGERVFEYVKTGRKITSKKRLDELNKQQDLIDDYNKNLGTPANPNQISGYAGQTWWSGAAKQVTVNGKKYYRNRQGKYVTQIGEAIDPKQQKEIDELNKQLKQQRKAARVKTGVSAGATAALSALLTTKQITQGDVSVEEDVLDKAVRTGLSGGLAAAGGAFLGPLGAMLGQTLGDGFASMFSKWYHRDELAMKQRVAEAKENLSALGDIKTAIENNEDLFNKTAYKSEDYEKLEAYADSLRKKFTDNSNLANSFLADVNNLGIRTFTTIEDVLSQITKGNVDINKQLNKQLKLTIARLTVENTLSKQGEDRTKIKSQIGKDIKDEVSSGWETRRVANLEATTRRGGNVRDLIYDTYVSPKNIGLYGQLKEEGLIDFSTYQLTTAAHGSTTYTEYIKNLSIAGNSIVEQLDNANKVLEKVRLIGDSDLVQKWEKVVDEYQKQVNKQTELNNELLSTQVDYAYLTSDILNTKSRDEIRDLGMEGVVRIIRDELISQGVGVVDEQGIIHQDAYDAIVKKIRSDSTLYDYISKDIRSIGELISKDDIDGIESFARAFGLTTEAAKELGKQFGYLTQSMGLMNVQETTEYYEKLSTVFSNLSSNVALTAGQINSLLTTSELKDLLPYLMNQDDPDALIKELYKRIYGGGQDVHMENALYDATMGMSTDKFREYLQNKGLKNYADEIDKGGYTTLSQIRDAVKEFDETDPRRQAFLEYLETINYTYSKDLTALEKPSEYIKSQLEEQINNLQEQKDALSQINDEREKELSLIKAKQALEDARKEKKRVYRQGIGFSYESNEEAIVEAQKNLEDLNTQKRQENLQTQIDALQMQKDIIEALPNQAELEQTKKIWELWAADKGTKGSLASVTEGVTMLADAYTNATNRMNMRAKTEGVLKAPDEKSSMQTSDKNTNPIITLSETQIEYTKTLVSSVDDIRNILLGGHSKNFQNMLDFVNKNNMLQGDYARWGEMFRAAGILNEWNLLPEEEKRAIRNQANTRAGGDISFQGGKALINELGTEAVITPGGTLTALPSKTGIVPADITRNVWALGEVAPTLVAQLGSLTQKTLSGNAGNTTYEEGQYFDNFTMNVYPAKGDDFNKILEQARAQMRLTRHNN